MKQLLILLVLASTVVFAADNPVIYENPPDGMYFRDWLLCGPFPNPLPDGITKYMFDETSLGHYKDYLTQYGGEGSIRPVEGMKIKHPDGSTLTWQHYHGYFGLILLDQVFTPKDQTIAYAACVVRSSIVRPVVLSLTSNDGVRVWQNGDMILEHNTSGSEEPDRDLIPIVLKKGDNHFLVKISQGFGKWSFQFRFLDMAETVKSLESRAHLFSRPEITEISDSYHIFVGQRHKIELLPNKVTALLNILDVDGRHVVASYDTFLGENIELNKAELNLAKGLHPVSCTVNLANGHVHTLRSSIFVGEPPSITETLSQFQNIPTIDSTSFLGKQIMYNHKCMDFHLRVDAKSGNLGAMDAWTQRDITNRYGDWITSVKNAPSPYHLVFPEIRDITILSNDNFNLQKGATFTDLTNGLFKADFDRIQESLQTNLGFQLKKNSKNGHIVFGLVHHFPEEANTVFPNDEAYKISISTDHIKVIGAHLRGLHFGLATLKHVLDMNKPLPVAELIDYPAAAHRATFQHLPVPMTQKWKDRILEYVDLKYNEIVVRSSDYRKMEDPDIAKGIKKYFDFIKSFHIEPVPLVWLNGDHSFYEGFWLENEKITFKNNRVEPGFQTLVDLNSSKPVFHSEINGGTIYKAGKDYKIISTSPPVIERISSGHIPENATIYMDADIVDRRSHRFSKPCSCEELAYEEFDRLVGQVIQTLKPNLFHVNHDELGILNSDSRCKKQNKKDYELVAYQINRMRDIIKKHDPNVDMIMWADAVNPYHNAGIKALERTCELLYKDIIMAHWYYTAENFLQRDLLEKGTTFFLDLGFRVYGCPWNHMVNHKAWESILSAEQNDSNFWGLMHTEWGPRKNGLAQTAAINWTGKTWLTK